jgi:predicted phosphodiesterase
MLAILADIHGNFPALEAVLDRIDYLGCDRIVSLGDVAGYYAQPNECIQALRAREIPNLMGNHDHYLVTGAQCPRSRSANDCLDYQRSVVSRSNIEWLASSPLFRSFGEINMVHGGWQDPLDEYILAPEESYFEDRPGRIFLSGHTHIPAVCPFRDRTYANPGSVGQPRDGDPRAAFAILVDGQLRIERVAYDVEATGRAMQKAGFDSYYYRNLAAGTRIGAVPETESGL